MGQPLGFAMGQPSGKSVTSSSPRTRNGIHAGQTAQTWPQLTLAFKTGGTSQEQETILALNSCVLWATHLTCV